MSLQSCQFVRSVTTVCEQQGSFVFSSCLSLLFQSTLGAIGFLREEPRSAISEERSGEERENRQEVRPAIFDWSHRANRFELGSRSDLASWLEEPYRCVVIGCLLIDLVMLIDTYGSMIVRVASPATRSFLSPLLSLSCLVSSLRKKTSGTRVVSKRGLVQSQSAHLFRLPNQSRSFAVRWNQ